MLKPLAVSWLCLNKIRHSNLNIIIFIILLIKLTLQHLQQSTFSTTIVPLLPVNKR